MILVTNKRSNSLPITGTILEQTPCAISKEVSQTSAGADFYPLEVSRENICPNEPVTGQQFDPRYINTGMSVTEFNLQSASGVLPQLRGLPLYTQYVPNDTFSKKQIQYVFYRRPTLAWSAKCDSNGQTRADAFALIQNPSQVQNPSHSSILSLAMFILGLALTLCPLYIFNVWTKQNGKIAGFTVAVMVSFQFLTVLILQIDARLTDIDSPTIDAQVAKMDILNICGDAYSQVDIGLYRAELN